MFLDKSFPKITVVTPSFNQGTYLEDCIKSVINQNYPNLEYIIIDGGSRDNSVSIIEKYSNYLNYWHSRPDKGQSDAIRQGFNKANGEIYSWLNSDDILCKDALFTVANAFNKERDLGLVYGNSFLINQTTELKRALIASKVDYQRLVYGSSSIFQGSVFFSMKAYHEVGGINVELSYAMEYDLFFQIAQLFKIGYVPEFLACFREQPHSKTSTIMDVGINESRKVLKQICKINADGFEYRLMKLFFSYERRLKNLLLGKTWMFRQGLYRKMAVNKLSHIKNYNQ